MPSAWFYASKDHGRINGRPFVPEAVCKRVMLNPLYQNLVDFSDLSRNPNGEHGNQFAAFKRLYKAQPSWTVAEICEAMGLPPRRPPLLPGTLAGDDSGAFQEGDEDPNHVGPETRKGYRRTPAQALDRQLAHEKRLHHPAVLAPENIGRYAGWMESLGTARACVPGHDRRRIATFNRDSDASFAKQEMMRRQLSMWDD